MSAGAASPEELEGMLEDACLVNDTSFHQRRCTATARPGRTPCQDRAQPSPESVGLRSGGGRLLHSRPPAAAATGASAELAEEFPHVADQEVGCFHCGEVAAAAELGPLHHVVVALGEGPDGGVAGEHGHRGRYP